MAHVVHRGFTRQAAAAAALPPWLTSATPTAHHTVNIRHIQTCRAVLQDHEPQDTQAQRLGQQEQHQQQPQDELQQGPPPSPIIDDWCQRSRLLVGSEGLARLASLNVLLVGLGGVGSFAAEFLCRAGVGSMTIVDGDTVDTTNRNRQLPALRSTVGQLKTQVVAQRLTDINPGVQLTIHQEFLDPVRASSLVQQQAYHYVIDCIDSVAPKQALLLAGHTAGIPTISSMGAGGRLDPSRVRLADISATHNDAFAAVVRKRLRKAGVTSGITVVFSDEPAQPASLALTQQQYKRSYFGTSSYIPALFGLYIASHVIRCEVEAGYKAPKPPKASSSSSSSSAGRKSRKRKAGASPGSSRGGSGSGAGGSSRGSRGSAGSSVDSSGDSDVHCAAAGAAAGVEGSPAAAAMVAAMSHPPAEPGYSSDSCSTAGSRGSQERRSSSSKDSSSSKSGAQLPPSFGAASTGQQGLFLSFDGSQGVGMGMDGEGL